MIVPLLHEGRSSAPSAWRADRRGRSRHATVALLQTFADQAVIAIENVRLFNETQEALQQQKAAAEVLAVISSSVSDTKPVFDKILESCKHLFGSDETAVLLVDEAEVVTLGAYVGKQHDVVAATFPAPLAKSPAGHAIAERRVVHYSDAMHDPRLTRAVRRVAELAGYQCMAYAPMLWNGRGIGAIGLSRISGAFSDKELAMLQTFADQAVIAIQNARLFNETQEALARETASAEILRVISESPTDVQPVFRAIVSAAVRLAGASMAGVARVEGAAFRTMALARPGQPVTGPFPDLTPIDPQANFPSRMIVDRQMVHIPDLLAIELPPHEQRVQAKQGVRSLLLLPMLREGEAVGGLVVARHAPGGFNAKELALLQGFVGQASIAIQNTRLFNETQQALEQQTASAEVLRVIGGSMADASPVFEAVADACQRLFAGQFVGINLIDERGGLYLATSRHLVGREFDRDALVRHFGTAPSRTTGSRLKLRGEVLDFPDIDAPGVPDEVVAACRIGNGKAIAFAPMVSAGKVIGTLWVARAAAGAMADKDKVLFKTFADQAVIAIQNARLFNATQEALEQQTATADILRVISNSPTDAAPVFDAIAERARILCGAEFGATTRFDGELLHMVGYHGISPEADALMRASFPRKPDPSSINGRCILAREPVQIVDIEQEPEYRLNSAAKAADYRSLLAVPILQAGQIIGVLAVARKATGAFPDKVISLLQIFADQAVIAIQNARLFNETQEALEQRTATAEILKVIASSPSDVQPVFDAIVAAAPPLVGGFSCAVWLRQGDTLHRVAFTEMSAAANEAAVAQSTRPIQGNALFEPVVRDGTAKWIVDYEASPEVTPDMRDLARARGFRSAVAIPLLADHDVVGVVAVTCREPHPFSAKEIELLSTFASQAVIAIQNVRLFRETNEALERQTATAEILKVIAGSPSDVQPVFDAIARQLEKAARRLLDDGLPHRRRRAAPGGLHGDQPPGRCHADGNVPAPDRRVPARRDWSAAARWRASTIPSRTRPCPTCCASWPASAAIGPCCSRPLMRDGCRARHDRRHARIARPLGGAPRAAAAHLRRPGGDRDRERAPVQRDAGGAAAADRDERDPAGDLRLAHRRAAGAAGGGRARGEDLRRAVRRHHPSRRRVDPRRGRGRRPGRPHRRADAAGPQHRHGPGHRRARAGACARPAAGTGRVPARQRAGAPARPPHHAGRAAAARGPRAGRDPGAPHRGAALRRQAHRAAAHLCRPGGDRDGERAAVQRDAGGTGAADRQRRCVDGDRQLGVRCGAGVRAHSRQRAAHPEHQLRQHRPDR